MRKYPTRTRADDPPGCNIRRLREDQQLSLRELAHRCTPELSYSAISRCEQNLGYTLDSVQRIAHALGVKPNDLFMPPELFDYRLLPADAKERIAGLVQDLGRSYRRPQLEVVHKKAK